MLRLSKQEYVESKIDQRRSIRFGILLVGSSGHVDSVLEGRETRAFSRAVARRLPTFLVCPFERHQFSVPVSGSSFGSAASFDMPKSLPMPWIAGRRVVMGMALATPVKALGS